MMTDTEKQRIEECVVQIECVNKLNKEEIELGTGFFVEKNVIITASHVIDKYYDNSSDYLINITPIKAKIDKKIKVEKVLECKRNNFVAILKLEENIETINPLKFTLGYNIKRGDEYFSFGHPQCKRLIGYPVENKVATSINENQSRKVNWDLNLTSERVEDFKGFSGSP
ncbi:MAG: serine protease, partial [Clostridium perfringens]|nr:serine protease [Clostridium perfringens]